MKWLVVAVALGIGLAAAAMLPRKFVHAEVVIQAQPEDVWRVLTDVGTHAEWNPIMTAIEGTFATNAVMRVDMVTSDGTTTPVETRVAEMTPARKLNQVGGVPGVLTFDHRWLLEPVEGGTRVVQHEEYRGIGVLFWDPGYVQAIYEQGVRALQARVQRET